MSQKPIKKAWIIYEGDNDNYPVIIYAKNAGKAKAEYIRCSEGCFSWADISELKCKRYKSDDMYLQSKHELLNDLSSKQIKHLTHSLGVEVGDNMPDEFYRNYSLYYEKHNECEELCKMGLMENWQRLGSECYCVSEKGIEAVKTLLLIRKP